MKFRDNCPSQRDIAKRAGVSAAAVSFALRNDTRISAPVRQEIQRIAKEMGYRPNPYLAAYQTSVRTGRRPKFEATLGWLNDHREQDFWKQAYCNPMLVAAKERAEALGYRLDEIWLPNLAEAATEEQESKWKRVLLARGIRGVILPWLDRAAHAVLPWDDFSVACIGRHHALLDGGDDVTRIVCEHHQVNPLSFSNMIMALKRLRKGGCLRIGLALSAWSDRESDETYSAAFLRESSERPSRERLPILFSDKAEDVAEWVRKTKPDAVVCSHPEVRRGLELAGLRIPRDIRLVHLNIAPDVAGWSGVDQRQELIGSAAVDLVASHLSGNECGVPPYPKQMFIEGVWIEGKT